MGTIRRRWTIELKVITTTVTGAAAGGAAAILNDVQADSSLLGGTPPWLQALVLVAAPTVATALTGWSTRHTPRPDLDVPRR